MIFIRKLILFIIGTIIIIIWRFMQKPFFKFTEAVNDNGTVWYTIHVLAKGDDPEPIIFKSRYSELRQIHEKCMETQYKNQLPDFPHKKVFGSTKEDFIQKRKKQLENYYNALSKMFDIQKLPELNKFIQSHRKKKVETKPVKKDDDNDNMETKYIKETQLKTAFENIYKEVLNQIVDLSSDFYPMGEMSHDDSSKRFTSEMQSAKPAESLILSDSKVSGIEQNDTDYWSMFLRDEHDEFVKKSQNALSKYNLIEKQLAASHKETIVLVK